MIGSGQFGKVHQGEWAAPGEEEKVGVALKTLKEGAGKEDKVKFLQEAAIMGQFSHPNVVKLHGVVTEGEPVSQRKTQTPLLANFNHNYLSLDDDCAGASAKRRSSQLPL